ncbi:uncharacterized protein TNCV_3576161 [Trichonephila clavipes]|nr:uncharacterized protein TNCV_3576161 [Trichonephila clavipes]
MQTRWHYITVLQDSRFKTASPQAQAQVVARFIEFKSATPVQRKWATTAMEFRKEDERGPMPKSAIKDLLKKWEAVRAMVLEWHPNLADLLRVGDLYIGNAINYFRKILKKREKQSTLDMFFNAP